MAELRNPIEPPKPWEILGAFFGYFAVAKDAPAIIRMLGIPNLVPESFKVFLHRWNTNSDFWLLILFTFLTFAVVFVWLPRKDNTTELSDREKHIADINKAIRKSKTIRIMRSLGFVLVREFILDLLGVTRYGTFSRPSDWQNEPDRARWIDRINLKSGKGVEYQYSKNFQRLIIREHPLSSDIYGLSAEREPQLREVPMLLVASNYFGIWIIAYLFKKLTSKIPGL